MKNYKNITRKPSTLGNIAIVAGLIGATMGLSWLGTNAIKKRYPIETECGYLTRTDFNRDDGINIYVVKHLKDLGFENESQLTHLESPRNYRSFADDSVCVDYIPRENALGKIADVYRADSSAAQSTATEPPR